MNDANHLKRAIQKAKESVAQGGFPAGAVVGRDGKIIGEGVSLGNKLNDPTSHAEIASIREACKHNKTTDLSDAVLYASMEPCIMCLGSSMWSGIPKIVFACSKDKVSADYYGGKYQTALINSELTSPIELVHLTELEEESLAVVREWETRNSRRSTE